MTRTRLFYLCVVGAVFWVLCILFAIWVLSIGRSL